ncbi:MAG: hypothetical protein CL840_19990 [Crocinitomicaceae bacterium]|nr:hypothetical protein [Crocinitomicaceae bacterium]|tara:strand:- start:19602 stop:20690 length:1089 start_codon:yes stop_codon:yes gene_type:complete
MIKKAISLFSILLVLFIACKKDKDKETPSGYDQSALLSNWSDNLIVPDYKSYVESTEKLRLEVSKIKENTNIKDLLEIKLLYREVCLSWQKVSFFEFGPAANVLLRANTNTYPCDTAGVESKISTSDLDLSKTSDLNRKGLPALDYVLYNPRINVLDKKRLDYVVAITTELASNASKVYNSWTGGYASTFKGSKGTSAGSSVSLMLNGITLHFERYLRDGKVGIPAGLRSFSGTPLPGHIESTYQAGSFSKELLRANYNQFMDIYRGHSSSTTIDGEGLDDYLLAIGAKTAGSSLDEAIENQFSEVEKSIALLPSNFNPDVIQQKDKFSNTHKEMQKLILLLKADVPSSLGVLISYQDSDGD